MGKDSFKNSVIYQYPLRFIGALLLVFLSFGLLSFSITQQNIVKFGSSTIDNDMTNEDQLDQVTPEVKESMLEARTDTSVEVDDEIGTPTEDVRREAISPREFEDDESVPQERRESFLD